MPAPYVAAPAPPPPAAPSSRALPDAWDLGGQWAHYKGAQRVRSYEDSPELCRVKVIGFPTNQLRNRIVDFLTDRCKHVLGYAPLDCRAWSLEDRGVLYVASATDARSLVDHSRNITWVFLDKRDNQHPLRLKTWRSPAQMVITHAMGCVFQQVLPLLTAEGSRFSQCKLATAKGGKSMIVIPPDSDAVEVLQIYDVEERSFRASRLEGFSTLVPTDTENQFNKMMAAASEALKAMRDRWAAADRSKDLTPRR